MSQKGYRQSNFGLGDFFIIVILLSVAAVSVNLFRHDLLQTLSLQNVEPVGTVVIRKNTVQRRFESRIVWDRLVNESPVYIGDLIRVAETSAATLKIDENEIYLEENTLIRIMLAPDGETLQIVLTEGTVSVVAAQESKPLELNVGSGQVVQARPGEVLTAVAERAPERNGASPERKQEVVVQTVGTSEWAAVSSRSEATEPKVLQLYSPVANSVFRFHDEAPVISFQWEELEDALSYLLEVSSSSNFNNLFIRRNTSASFLSDASLEEGLWFWRVLPVYPSVLSDRGVHSNIYFFRLEKVTAPTVAEAQTAQEQTAQTLQEHGETASISQRLAVEVLAASEPPPQVPPEIASVVIPPVAVAALPATPVTPTAVETTAPTASAEEETPSAAPPAPPAPPPPPARLAAPRNLQPANRTTYGMEQLRNRRNISFSWSAVSQANAYIFTLYQQTSSGRRQIVRTNPLNRTNYTFENLSSLDRGTFIWQVEAVRTNRNGIERRGTVAQSTFILDFPVPGPVQIEDSGELYGY